MLWSMSGEAADQNFGGRSHSMFMGVSILESFPPPCRLVRRLTDTLPLIPFIKQSHASVYWSQ
jgi:hypothetical protein